MIRNFLMIGLGGCLGSMLRYGCALLIGPKPYGTSILIINILGSFFIGLIMAYSFKNQAFADNWKLFLATGVCGGFTTFSAFSFDNLQLLQAGKIGMLTLNISASVLLGLGAVWLGFKVVNFIAA